MWRRAAGLGLVALLVTTASLFACRQLVGITDNPPEDLVTSICGLPYGTNTCASCVNTSCCSESMTCADDPACAAYEGCLGKCNGDPGCRSQCIVDNPVGTSGDVPALSACIVSNCETACGLACGAMAGDITPPDASAPCEKCLESSGLCDQGRACGSSIDCQAYAQCLRAFTTLDWRQACGAAHDAGATLFAPIENGASAAACSAACAYGQDWRCVGHVAWPAPVASVTTITDEAVHDGITSIPIAAEVLACSPSAATGVPPCDPPLIKGGQTSDAGFGEIEVPTVEANSSSLTGWEGWFVVSAAGYLPSYNYSFFPLSQTQLTYAPNSSAYLYTASELATAYAEVDAGVQVSGTGSGQAFVHDCQGHFAPDVQVSADNPSIAASALTDGGLTSASGGWVFGDVPVGNLTLTVTPLGLGQPIGQFSFYVSASAYTVVGLFPQP
jgi:hypothetical protein